MFNTSPCKGFLFLGGNDAHQSYTDIYNYNQVTETWEIYNKQLKKKRSYHAISIIDFCSIAPLLDDPYCGCQENSTTIETNSSYPKTTYHPMATHHHTTTNLPTTNLPTTTYHPTTTDWIVIDDFFTSTNQPATEIFTTTSPTTNCEKGWTFYYHTGKCYKYISSSIPASQVVSYCQKNYQVNKMHKTEISTFIENFSTVRFGFQVK